MELHEQIVRDLPLEDAEDLDVLLEFADLIREALAQGRLTDLSAYVRYTVRHGYHEALSWALELFQEYRDRTAGGMELECVLGKLIPDYNGFISRLGVDLNAFSNDVEPIRDENGEIQSFYNIIRYQTAFPGITLVTSENFDTRDNDFIEYRLVVR